MAEMDCTLVYGDPPPALVDRPERMLQVSPLVPGATALDALPAGGSAGAIMLAPPGTLERRHDIALLLKAVLPGAFVTVLAPKDMGGARLSGELERFGCTVDETAKRHHRICTTVRPARLDRLDGAVAEGTLRHLAEIDAWSQPGIFSWDRVDSGTALLLEELPALRGRGADLGCGIGLLARTVLAAADVAHLHLVDIDRRALEAARRNIDDPRAALAWADVRGGTGLSGLDFVVMNPPFHAAGQENRTLGQIFIRRAAEALKTGGRLWLVANRHLPYEAALKPLFKRVEPKAERGGFKVFEAVK